MINPVELISHCRRRLARLAAGRVVIAGMPVVAVTIALGASVDPAAARIWRDWGYLIAPRYALILRAAAYGAAGLSAQGSAYLAWRAWRRANDFAQAAQRVDELIGAHQEVLTLATLADPAHPEASDRRSPLFAILWRRAINYLERFEPNREFRLEPAAPLKRSSLFAATAVVVLALTMLALMQVPSPTQAVAYRLRDFADISAATTSSDAVQIAAAARAVANDLENPRLPPEQKIAELESIKRAIEKFQQPPRNAQSGTGNANGNGSGAGNGSGGTGQGTDGGVNDKGAGAGSGSGDRGNKSDQQRMTLKNDIAKAQAKLEAEANSHNNSATAQNQDQKGSGLAPQAGHNPEQKGPEARPNGTDNMQLPEPGKLGQSEAPPSSSNPSAHKDDKGSQGDTHLGDFPKSVAYERFYKLGDKGPPLDLKDARYVRFRLPPAVVSGSGEGRVVQDSRAPAATTPYTNAPLKEQRLVASPDEEQLLPPWYRDLIR